MSSNLEENIPNSAPNNLPTEAEVEREASEHTGVIGNIFRVAKCERSMFFRMASMFFIIAYVYSIMRNAKDAFVLDKQEQASMTFLKNAITFISVFSVMLLQFLFTKTRISNILMTMTIIYGFYFILFAWFLNPFHESIEPFKYFSIDLFGEGKLEYRKLKILYALSLVFNYWVTSLFYIASELWGNLVLSLLFLSFSNDILTFKQSLRFIPLFFIASNIGLFFSGITMLVLGKIIELAPYFINRHALTTMFTFIGIITFLCAYIHYKLESETLKTPIFIVEGNQVKKTKIKVGMMEGLRHCFQSKLLMQMCLIVLSYNITVNIIDSLFKRAMKVKSIADNRATDSFTMISEAQNQIVTASCVIVILCTPVSRLVQTLGWLFAGCVAPLFALITSAVVLSLAIYNTSIDKTISVSFLQTLLSGFSTSFLSIEFHVGRFTSAGFKVMKYAFFDVAKEALSMRINRDKRATYKAVYDGVIGKLGKGMNSLISLGLFTLFNTDDIRAVSFWLLIISATFLFLWFNGVIYLSKKYENSVATNENIDLDYFAKTKAGVMH